jgi:hypothetical protein
MVEMAAWAKPVSIGLYVLSLGVIIGMSLYPNEWGALTKFDQDHLDAMGAGVKSGGFTDRFNIEYTAADSLVHGKSPDVTATIALKCADYKNMAKSHFKERCEEIKITRPIYGGAILLMLALGAAELSGTSVTLFKVTFSVMTIRVLAAVVSLTILALASRTLHVFTEEKDSIGALNDHGKVYFGVSVTFSATLFLAVVAGMWTRPPDTAAASFADLTANLM